MGTILKVEHFPFLHVGLTLFSLNFNFYPEQCLIIWTAVISLP